MKKDKKENITFEEKLGDLFLKGENIKRSSRRIKDCMELSELQRSYFLWRHDFLNFVEINKISHADKYPFYADDEVLPTAERGCGIDINDPFAKKLLEDIQKETDKKLKFLTEIDKIQRGIISDKGIRMRCHNCLSFAGELTIKDINDLEEKTPQSFSCPKCKERIDIKKIDEDAMVIMYRFSVKKLIENIEKFRKPHKDLT